MQYKIRHEHNAENVFEKAKRFNILYEKRGLEYNRNGTEWRIRVDLKWPDIYCAHNAHIEIYNIWKRKQGFELFFEPLDDIQFHRLQPVML